MHGGPSTNRMREIIRRYMALDAQLFDLYTRNPGHPLIDEIGDQQVAFEIEVRDLEATADDNERSFQNLKEAFALITDASAQDD